MGTGYVTGSDFYLFFQGKEKEADQVRKKLSEGSCSDHIMLWNAYKVINKGNCLCICNCLCLY